MDADSVWGFRKADSADLLAVLQDLPLDESV